LAQGYEVFCLVSSRSVILEFLQKLAEQTRLTVSLQ
jgi:hypothetical protein